MSRPLAIAVTGIVALCCAHAAFGQGPFSYIAPSATLQYDPMTGDGAVTVAFEIEEDPGNPGFPNDTNSFSMAVASDSDLVEPTGVVPAPVLGNPAFFAPDLWPEGWTVGVVYSFGYDPIPYPEPTPVVFTTYASVADNPMGILSTPLEFTDTLGMPPVINVVVLQMGAQSMPVVPINGVLELVPGPTDSFRRGDADGNGSTSGLVDGVFLLNYQFVAGSPEPPCLDAADADDSGSVNGLVDGLFLLNYQFVPGSPPPPAPGSSDCGVDPTDDALVCQVYDLCP